MKNTSFFFIASMLLLVLAQPSEAQSFAKNSKHLDKILMTAVSNVSLFINCDKSSNNNDGRCHLVCFHQIQKNKEYQFSIENFPFNKADIDSLCIIGYYNIGNDKAFIAVEKGYKLTTSNIITTNLSTVVDSSLNRYSSYNPTGSFIVYYYYYLFEFEKFNPKWKKTLKLKYKFYSNIDHIPYSKRGFVTYHNKYNSRIQYSDFSGTQSIFNSCENYYLISEEKKTKYREGVIKIKFW